MTKKNRKKKKRGRSKKPSGPFCALVENPFPKLPNDILVQSFLEAGEYFGKEFDELFGRLQDLVTSLNPMHLLSILPVYGLFAGMSKFGKLKQKRTSLILQPHIELVQALVLRIRLDELSHKPPIPAEVQEIFDLLRPLGEAFAKKRYLQIRSAKSEKERAILYFQERARSHTQMVRNWGYFSKVISISKRLYEPLNPTYESLVGVGATVLIEIFERLVADAEKRVSKHWQQFRPVLRAKSIEQAVRAYYSASPDLKGSPEELVDYFRSCQTPLEVALSIILSHYDLRLSELFTFSAEDFAEKMSCDSDRLCFALSRLSFSFGDLEDVNPENLFLANPVWTRPLIKIGDSTFFCSMPQMFFSFVFKVLNTLIDHDQKAKKACADRRAKFLEEEVLFLMKNAFKDGVYIKNFRWKESTTEYETDLIYKVDSYLFVIEAKSGAISWPALRGAPKRMEQHMKELFINPAVQSQRLASKLFELKSRRNDHSHRVELPFKIDEIQKIIRLSITLEDFATIQSNISSLKATGWLDEEFTIAPTITLADLEVVFDILSSAPEKIHYLVRRSELEEHLQYIGCELDLLGLYLETAFNLGEIEVSQNCMILVGMSKKIDQYYVAQDQGISRNKPSLKSTRWWRDIRNYIEMRSPPRWSEGAVMLLNIAFDDQVRVQKKFKRVIKNVKKNWSREGHLNSVFMVPPKWRSEGVCLFAFRESNKQKRYDLMENLAGMMFEETHVARCLIIGVNIDKLHYPYSIFAVFDR